jgi:hypothetical protein
VGLPFEGHSSRDASIRSREMPVVGLSSSNQVAHNMHIAIKVVGSCASTQELRNFIVTVHSTVAVASADIPFIAVTVIVATEEPLQS